MSDSPEDKGKDKKEKDEIVIDLSGAFYSPVEKYSKNSENMGEDLPFHVDPNSVGNKSMTNDSIQDEFSTEEDYNGRYEFLRKASTQIASDDGFSYGLDPNDLVEPTYDPSYLVNLNEISYVRNACIVAIARNTVGLGYRIKKIDPTDELFDHDEISEKIRDQLEHWASRDQKTFTELMYAVKYDEETTGNGYIEVSRNRRGEIDGLYHVPAHTIRMRRDRSGYVQDRGLSSVPFYQFGDKVKILDDGSIKYLPDRNPLINEIIHFKLYHTRDQYYGIPRDTGVFVTIAGDEMARNHNIKYFTHSAVPDLLMMFKVNESQIEKEFGDQPVKVDIPDDLKHAVSEHFRRSLSSQNFVPGLFFLPMGVDAEIERISQGQKDAGWVNYRQENRDEVRIAFGVPPILIGDADSSGYATAVAEKAVFLEQVIQPEQLRYQQRLMGMLWPEMIMIKPDKKPMVVDEEAKMREQEEIDVTPRGSAAGINSHIWVLEFNKMEVVDRISLAQVHNIYGSLGVLSRNEMRQDLGKKPIDEEGSSEHEPMAGSTAPDPGDIRGLAGRPGGGRGPNGSMNLPMPRRPGEESTPMPANSMTVGMPGSDMMGMAGSAIGKRAEENSSADLVKAVKDRVKKNIEENPQNVKKASEVENMPNRVEKDLLEGGEA